ncbi:MAG: non-ribosomal peptide synthetase [Micromonosporaceae bacterium]
MSHLRLLAEIESRGLSISAAGEDLKLQGPRDRMDPELIGRIKEYKAQLVSHLSAERDPGFPTTPLQRSYLLGRGDLFEFGNVANHIYREIEGCWDLDRLDAAYRSVVRRHGMLRTRFTADGRQVEEPALPELRIPRLDLRGLDADEQRRMRQRLREERSHRVLPTDQAPLLGLDVTIFADDRLVIHVGQDGLVMDAVSAMLFMRAWWAAYQELPTDPPEEASFAEYVARLEAARDKPPYARSRDYWLARLDELPPCPRLPLRTSPAAITHPRFVPRTVSLDPPAWEALKARAAAAGLTPSSVLFAGYAETLAAWGAGERFTLNTTVTQRPPVHPRIFEAIGPFSDTLLVEVTVGPGVSFTERARALQTQLRRDLDNRHFSGIDALRELGRRAGGAPVRMPFTFNSALGYPQRDLDGSTFELFGPEVYSVSQTPQVWVNVFVREQHGGLLVQIDAVDELFPEGLLDALVDGYRRLLEGLRDDAAWSANAADLLPEAQRARRRAANDTTRPEPSELPHQSFVRLAAAHPDAPAVLTSGGNLSYGDLYRRACHAAAWLSGQGVGCGDLVGVVMTRGPEQVVGILAAVLAGAAYLPVDATAPAERQRYLLRDGQVRCVITNADLPHLAEEWQVYAADPSRPLDVALEPPPDVAVDPDDLAYVLYTSGTTGEPKGVMVSHRSVANVVVDCHARFGVTAADRFFGISAFTFDLSVYDVFGALSAGAAIVLPDADRAADAAHWLSCCDRFGVTIWNSVPSIVALLADQAVAEPASLGALRLVMMSGDRIPPALPAALRRLKPELEVVSLGGPTETTVWNIVHPITPDHDGVSPIPYGRPNANSRLYVIDGYGRDAPDWVPGEICAAGIGLARGYWRDPDRTGERFYSDAARGERLYRTGDMGRYLPDGSIEILGRADHQLKVNGYRIEAGEVEARLTAIEGVRQAAVLRAEGANGARLIAHLVAGADAPPSYGAVREGLAVHLPEYMIPAELVWHEALPLTGNGKVDRAALATTSPGTVPGGAPTGTGAAGTAQRRPEAGDRPPTATERELSELWASVLGVPGVGIDQKFRELGGDSIGAARIVTRVRKRFGVAIPMHRLAEVETVRAMASFVDAARDG